MSKTALIAIVDDDETIREAIDCLLRSHGLTTCTFASAEDFLGSHRSADASCLISDIQMPGMSGLDLNRHLIDRGLHIPMIFISAFPAETVRIDERKAAAVRFLRKPFDAASLMRCIDEILADPARAAAVGVDIGKD